jgi:hypothetical protein
MQAKARKAGLDAMGRELRERDKGGDAARLRRVLWRIAEDPGDDERGHHSEHSEAQAWRRAKDMAIDVLGEAAEPCREESRP